MVTALKNHHVIITGGTGFLGRAIAAEFIKNGASIFTNYRNSHKFEDLKKLVGDTNKLVGFQADLTSETEVKSFFREFNKTFNRLDVFLHVMGGFWMGNEITDTALENWNRMMELNLTSAFLCIREAFGKMKEQCSGKIFTVSSKTTEDYPATMGAYSVSKAAVLALTKVIANEGKAYNIQANSILPSIIDTPANRKAMPQADHSTWVTPKEIAVTLAHLCKPEVKALSHTELKVYGQL